MTFIDTVLPVTPIICNGSAHQCAKKEPVQIPQDCKENIFTRERIRVFLVEESEVVILIVIGHKANYLMVLR